MAREMWWTNMDAAPPLREPPPLLLHRAVLATLLVGVGVLVVHCDQTRPRLTRVEALPVQPIH